MPPCWPSGCVSGLTAGVHGIQPCFSRSSHTSDSKIGTLVATFLSAWHDEVIAGTGWPSVSIL